MATCGSNYSRHNVVLVIALVPGFGRNLRLTPRRQARLWYFLLAAGGGVIGSCVFPQPCKPVSCLSAISPTETTIEMLFKECLSPPLPPPPPPTSLFVIYHTFVCLYMCVFVYVSTCACVCVVLWYGGGGGGDGGVCVCLCVCVRACVRACV